MNIIDDNLPSIAVVTLLIAAVVIGIGAIVKSNDDNIYMDRCCCWESL